MVADPQKVPTSAQPRFRSAVWARTVAGCNGGQGMVPRGDDDAAGWSWEHIGVVLMGASHRGCLHCDSCGGPGDALQGGEGGSSQGRGGADRAE